MDGPSRAGGDRAKDHEHEEGREQKQLQLDERKDEHQQEQQQQQAGEETAEKGKEMVKAEAYVDEDGCVRHNDQRAYEDKAPWEQALMSSWYFANTSYLIMSRCEFCEEDWRESWRDRRDQERGIVRRDL